MSHVIDKEKSLAYHSPELAKEWHPTKNGALTAADITFGSKQIVWWKCALGHEWQATVNQRRGGRGCPYCTNRKILVGFNDILTTDPIIAEEWNYEKNGDLLPTMVGSGSAKNVWWRCKKGHEWQAKIYSRTQGKRGCPYCRNLKILAGDNDLMNQNPQLAAEWNYDRNGTLTPAQVSPFSKKKVWWKCEKGHEWEARIASRNPNNNCPYCGNKKLLSGFNDLATKHPDIAADWDYNKNEENPTQVLASNISKRFWICRKCGYGYEKSVYNRIRSPKCPKCKK